MHGTREWASHAILRDSDARGKEVTTIEGPDENGLQPVQRAWMQTNVPQCGYCQVGQIMQAPEEIVGEALRQHGGREAVILATKVGIDWSTGRLERNSAHLGVDL